MNKKHERGALIVEASIVFPVMFLVIFFMIFTGNAYLQKSRVEGIISRCAVEGASKCANPLLNSVTPESIPSVDSIQLYPYRYFKFGGAGAIEGAVQTSMEQQIRGLSSGLFDGMKPEGIVCKAHYNPGFMYATFSADASYKIKIPVRLLGDKDNLYMKVSSHVELPVSDTTEMIRNIDMVWDYMERFGVAEKINEMTAKVKEWMN